MGRLFVFVMFFSAVVQVSSSVTDPRDGAALQSLKEIWRNLPPSWMQSDDPCGSWEGVTCKNSRVSALGLSSMGLKGKLSGDIGGLTELRSLDLSYNRDLVGPLTPRLGDLQNLNNLIMVGCGFSGGIPDELGSLSELSFLALNSNNLTGRIPPSIGNLSKLYWLDLADNQLTGPIPVSTSKTPGLDLLLKAKHFHFNKNQLSGPIPPKLFRPDMVLIHVLFDGNKLNGTIPATLGLVPTIEVLRLDRNALTGRIPLNLNNLLNINELNLAHNRLTGSLPNLTGMNNLNYLDLSNNFFEPSEAPSWFSTLPSLTTLVMEHGSLQGPLPPTVFSFPQIQQVLLSNNAFNGTLTMGDTISPQLQLVDLQNNQISSATLTAGYTNTLILVGNPVCTALSNTNYCQIERQQSSKVYSTSLANCGTKICTADQKLSPQSCECAYPYEGTLYFRGPAFRDLTDVNTFHALEMSLWVKLGLTPGSVSLQNPIFNSDDYLQVQLGLFPPTSAGKYFNRSEIQRIGFDLSNQTYKPPSEFGPYYFIAAPYPFPGVHGGAAISRGVIAGIASGCAFLVLCLVGVAIYAIRQKKRAEKAIVFSKPFASWAAGSRKDHSGGSGAPQLKGARWFSYDELKKCTSNFSGSNEIGSGGYGKVYRGMLSDGQLVAIKRARQGSLQGGQEFKTEIELLSRVHHKNLLALIGFCFEQGEQMLVYEFMPNGTLKESLTGKSGIHLDWRRRLRIALGSARGLAYLHELANPPIIHRDIKSTNILLDENLSAKVADFGLSKLVSDSTKGHVSTQVKGTLGYLDPEYYMSQQLTEKSDVYSFGVVVLELVTAKQPIEKGKYIVRQVRMKMIPEAGAEAEEEDQYYCGLKDMIDPTIVAEVATAGTTLRRVLDLAMQCVEESAEDRPTMSQVVKTIEAILQEEGVNGNSTSASSSATDFGIHCLRGAGGGNMKHPYCGSGEVCVATNNTKIGSRKVNGNEQCDAFDYSGGYGISTTVEPK
ncbi:Leucine-rich repeat receptor protein kinase HPCA1 [Linum perenne]